MKVIKNENEVIEMLDYYLHSFDREHERREQLRNRLPVVMSIFLSIILASFVYFLEQLEDYVTEPIYCVYILLLSILVISIIILIVYTFLYLKPVEIPDLEKLSIFREKELARYREEYTSEFDRLKITKRYLIDDLVYKTDKLKESNVLLLKKYYKIISCIKVNILVIIILFLLILYKLIS